MFKKILTAGDGSDHALLALQLAADMAVGYGAELLLVTVKHAASLPQELRDLARAEHLLDEEPPPPFPAIARLPSWIADALESAQRAGEERRLLETLAGQILQSGERIARERGVERLRTSDESGDPAERILARAEEEAVDAIVMGSHGHGRIEGVLLGSVSQAVAHRCGCHCITVKHGSPGSRG